jgi:protein TonB
MFEDSLVESAAVLRTHNRWPAVVSITAQLCAATLILTIPLLHPEVLPMPHILPTTLAPPRPPAPAPLIHLEPRRAATTTSAPVAPVAVQTTSMFRDLIHPTGPAIDAPALPVMNLGDTDASLPPDINSVAPAGPNVTVGPPAAAPSKKPLQISQGVLAGYLLGSIRPEYPQIARAAHVDGSVVIDAIISRSGTIESARIVSGPPMLQPAALAAVRQARYRPFLLNGQPTEVQTTITINFRMGG